MPRCFVCELPPPDGSTLFSHIWRDIEFRHGKTILRITDKRTVDPYIKRLLPRPSKLKMIRFPTNCSLQIEHPHIRTDRIIVRFAEHAVFMLMLTYPPVSDILFPPTDTSY